MEPSDTHPLEAYPIYREDLPREGRDLVDLIGWPCTRVLVRELGGCAFAMPKGKNNNREGEARYEHLVELVGEEAAHALFERFRGSILSVPTCFRAIALARQRRILARYDEGTTLEQLSREFHVTQRWLSAILKKDLTPVGDPLE